MLNDTTHNIPGQNFDATGTEYWLDEYGSVHREDGPAIIEKDCIRWIKHDKIHREDGPAIVYLDGREEWYLHGNFHRVGGPAVIRADGTTAWYFHGKFHREDGPAIIRADGNKQWWLNGKPFHSFDVYAIAAGWSTEQIIEWKLTHEHKT